MWLMARSYQNAKLTRTWVESPAMILQADIIDRQIGTHVPTDYAANVLYGYEFNGSRLTSRLISPRGSKWAKDRGKAELELEGLETGLMTTCWVNPQHPHNAILRHDTKAAGYSIWFPTLFFVGGLGVMAGAFRRA